MIKKHVKYSFLTFFGEVEESVGMRDWFCQIKIQFQGGVWLCLLISIQCLECSGPLGHCLPITWEPALVIKRKVGENRSKKEFSSRI